MGHYRFTRRGLLARAGAGALGATLVPSAAGGRRDDPGIGGFGRMFDLPPFAAPSTGLERSLLALGRPGGPMDARDDLAAGAAALVRAAKPTSALPAGATFLAQLATHDVTFDALSTLGRPAPLASAFNARSARFDLENVYGGGPDLAPGLYDPLEPAKLRVGDGDLPRASNGTAEIGDPRDDQTLVLAALHLAFLRFHNRVVDELGNGSGRDAFAGARRETQWHYQWLLLHELLPQIAGQKVVEDVLRHGRRHFRPTGRPYVPVEFAAAVFRFGHATVHPAYRLNRTTTALLFDARQEGSAAPTDLRGGFPPGERTIDWSWFFDVDGSRAPRAARIDTRIATPLLRLPLGTIPGRRPPTSLAQRDLLRHVTWRLPSGQAVARRLGAVALAPADLAELRPLGLDRSTPLSYYVLREAELTRRGARLGPTGARIVAEVIVGLLQLDKGSFLHAKPGWRPTLGGAPFGIADLLALAE